MIIIGIDPGSRRCGWGVVHVANGQISHGDNGVIAVPERQPLAQRLRRVHAGLVEVITAHRPTHAAIEQIFVGHGNARSALALGHARGVALLALAQADLIAAEYSAQQVKKAAAGTGKADKEQVQRMVALRLGLPESPQEDAADAVAVALCHAQHLALGVPPPATRRPKKQSGRAGLTAWVKAQQETS
jgi:crossover junction endodeoxyribonuclease RuvC